MVQLKHCGKHFPKLMVNLNNLKKEGSLCDIDLVVGDTRIPAHKCILAAGSDYCKSLFCGPLKQNLSEVDLSTITDDIDCVIEVLDFLYTGDINLDNENLGPILKLSSFLLIEMLRGICIEYMDTNLGLDNCIQFYLLASEFMVPELDQTLSDTVSSRFHDYLMFRQSSLNVTPNQLKYLMDSCNIFDYGSDFDIISFIINWVANGKTEAHDEVGCEVIDVVKGNTVISRSKLSLEQNISILKEQIQIKLEHTSVCPRFLSLLQEIINKRFAVDEIQSRHLSLNNGCTDMVPVDQETSGSETEDVLIALAPNKRLIFLTDQKYVPYLRIYKMRYEKALLDVCVYIPRKKMWYYMTEGYCEYAFQELTEGRTYSISNAVPIILMDNRICFSKYDTSDLYIYDLNSFTCDIITYYPELLDTDNEDFSTASEDTYIVYSEQKLYLFLRHYPQGEVFSVFNEKGIVEVSVDCYVLMPDDTWDLKFSTPVIGSERCKMKENRFVAAVSNKSKEMIMVHLLDKFHVFVVDIDSGKYSYRQFELDIQCTRGLLHVPIHILDNGDDLAIIIEPRNADNQILYKCVCQYKLSSKELITDMDSDLIVDRFNQREHLKYEKPCSLSLRASDNKHIWMFEGNGRDGSSLKSVSFKGEDGMIVCSHTPPPFSCISGMVAGKIKRECIAALKPITRYMHEDVKDFIPSEEDIPK